MTERRSTQAYSPDEIKLELSLQGEGMESLECQERFLTARQALHDSVAHVMQGEGESAEAIEQYVKQLLDEVAKSFAEAVQMVDEGEQQSFAGLLLSQSTNELADVAASTGVVVATVDYNADAAADLLEQILAKDDLSAQAEDLEQVMDRAYSLLLSEMFTHAPYNKSDVRRHRRDQLISRSRKVMGEAGRVALGAVVAVAATRFLNNRQR